MSTNPTAAFQFEYIDAGELAKRLNLPTSWIYDQSRSRVPDDARIPTMKFGRYSRFAWGSPELASWIEGRLKGGKR